MNVLEIYLKEIHEEKPYITDWCKKFPDREFIKVTATWICYGRVFTQTSVYTTEQWEDIKERGYYLG